MKSFNILNSKKCLGCGIILTNDPNNLGYTPKKIDNINLCQSCYQLKHYAIAPKINLIDDSFFLNQIKKFDLIEPKKNNKFLTIIVTDIYNLGVVVDLENKLYSDWILICINKIDLINYFQKKFLLQYWTNFIKPKNKRFKIVFVSALKKEGLISMWNQLQQFNTLFLMGNSGVGKSQIVNQICKKFNIKSKILVGSFLNTTKNIISTKIQCQKIVDTPGLIRCHGIFQYLGNLIIKDLQQSVWCSKVFQFFSSKTYLIENFCVIQINVSLIKNNKMSFVFYGPKTIKIKHIKNTNFSETKLNQFSVLKQYEKKIKWIKYNYKITAKTYFVIDDLGWFNLNPNDCELDVILFLPLNVFHYKFNNYQE